MIRLSDFIGELVSDISDARKIVDSNSASLSQSYHTDPFLKGMPVPHYTVTEAEIRVPMSVMGVISDIKNEKLTQDSIISAIKLKLPQLLNNLLVSFYIQKRKSKKEDELLKRQAVVTGDGTIENNNSPALTEVEETDISRELRQKYASSSNKIAKNMEQPMIRYLSTVNFEIVKLLDIKDKFAELLKNAIRDEFASFVPEEQPVDFDTLEEIAAETGRRMFFEFNQTLIEDKGVFIEPNTGKMNEYGEKDNLMYMTIKIKEQDLDLVVEDGNSGANRFLSLN